MANNKTTTSSPKGTNDVRNMTDTELQQKFGDSFNKMVDDKNELIGIYDKYLNLGFNFFCVSDMARREIKHSRVLSWFLRPTENPGAGGYILKELLKLKQIGWDLSEPECETFTVVNEEFNIDILIYSKALKKVVVIENKIDAAERTEGLDGGQLEKYYKYISESPTYKDCESKFIFLSPDGRKPSAKNIEKWETLDYKKIKKVIEKGWGEAKKAGTYQGKPKPEIICEIDVLVNHYLKLIERSITMTMDDNFRTECVKFYRNHRDVLDAMFVIVKDAARQINDFVWEELKKIEKEKGLTLDEQINTNTSRYFTTPFLSKIAQKNPGKKADCMYEILTTNTDGSVLKCTIFRANDKAEAMREMKLKKSATIKNFPVSFTLMSLCKKEIISNWLDDTDKAKTEILKKFNEAMEALEEFEKNSELLSHLE